MRRIYLILLSFIVLSSFSNLCAQTNLEVEYRPRTEFREGFRKPMPDTLQPSFITLQRTRFNADYKGKIINARISLQDARIWGNSDTKTNSSKIEINEAWFEYLMTSGLSVQMGRQALKYDDLRLFSSPNWSNTGTSHDVALLKFNCPFVTIHTGFAYNNSKDTLVNTAYAYTPKQSYKTLAYTWITKRLSEELNLSMIIVGDGFEAKTNPKMVYGRLTYGGNLVYSNDSSNLSFILTAYKQQGIDPNKTAGKSFAKLDALFLAAKLSYKIMDKFIPAIGIDYYSGSASDIDATKSRTFNRLYGAPHVFNGYMEYFSSLPTQGLIDYYYNLTYQINSKIYAEMAGHNFNLEKDLMYKDEKKSKKLGSEIDFTLKYNASKDISFQIGYSIFFNTSSTLIYYKMPDVKVHNQQWAYLMIAIKPQLYKTPPIENK